MYVSMHLSRILVQTHLLAFCVPVFLFLATILYRVKTETFDRERKLDRTNVLFLSPL